MYELLYNYNKGQETDVLESRMTTKIYPVLKYYNIVGYLKSHIKNINLYIVFIKNIRTLYQIGLYNITFTETALQFKYTLLKSFILLYFIIIIY
jgi:hypothetical protein